MILLRVVDLNSRRTKYSDTIHIQEILEQFYVYICASFYEIYTDKLCNTAQPF